MARGIRHLRVRRLPQNVLRTKRMLQLHMVKLPGLPCWQQYLLQVSFDSAIDLHGVFATLLTRSNFAMRPGYCMMQEPPQPLQQQRPMHLYSSTGSRHTTATPIYIPTLAPTTLSLFFVCREAWQCMVGGALQSFMRKRSGKLLEL